MLFAEILSFVCLIDRTGKVLTLELSFTFSLCSSFCLVSGLKLYFLSGCFQKLASEKITEMRRRGTTVKMNLED